MQEGEKCIKDYCRQSDGINDIRGHWAEEDLNKWMEKGILVGYQDGTIRPDNNITRAEFVTLINKVFGLYELSREQFADVEDSKWYSREILKARAAGYIDKKPLL